MSTKAQREYQRLYQKNLYLSAHNYKRPTPEPLVAAKWQRFCRTIEQRIEHVRRTEPQWPPVEQSQDVAS